MGFFTYRHHHFPSGYSKALCFHNSLLPEESGAHSASRQVQTIFSRTFSAMDGTLNLDLNNYKHNLKLYHFYTICSQVMIRARLLRENGKYLPRQSFAMRRHFFNNEETGYFKVQKRAAASQVPIDFTPSGG